MTWLHGDVLGCLSGVLFRWQLPDVAVLRSSVYLKLVEIIFLSLFVQLIFLINKCFKKGASQEKEKMRAKLLLIYKNLLLVSFGLPNAIMPPFPWYFGIRVE
jgi:hypothetical protein